MIPAFLRDRYDLLTQRWRERWPTELPPPFPDGDDPNAVVNVNQLLVARLTGRAPILVAQGDPVLVRDVTPTRPGLESRRGA